MCSKFVPGAFGAFTLMQIGEKHLPLPVSAMRNALRKEGSTS